MSQIIEVVAKTQRIVVDPSTQAVSVINAGPQGPAGVGGTASNFFHTQVSENPSWVINHNLGFRPSVDTYNVDGSEVEGHVIHHTLNQLEIQFLTPRAGTARLS